MFDFDDICSDCNQYPLESKDYVDHIWKLGHGHESYRY